MIWKIWFYTGKETDPTKNTIYLDAPDLDEAFALARSLDKRYNSGCVHRFKDDVAFRHTKARFMSMSIKDNMKCRYNVIEYVCSFSEVNPIAVAASLMKHKVVIVYDDASISFNENTAKRKAVESYYDYHSNTMR